MLKKFINFAVASFVFFACVNLAIAVNFPEKPVGFVNDFANILKQEQRAELESILKDFEVQTSNEIVVVTVNSFGGLDSFTYSQELFTKWGIGKENKNNGVLFLIGPSEGLPFPERGEIFINVGKGLEGALPDSLTGTILRKEISPKFKTADYFNGVKNGVLAIISATKGEYKAFGAAAKTGGLNIDPIFLIWVGFIFLSYIASFLARSKSWWLGGVLGGAGGVILGFIFWAGFWILVSGGVLGMLGFLFDYIVSKNYQKRLAAGKPTDFWHSGGGFWFGGGRGGFGGGGGFGGFGGGISGGGGAGGRW
ncbi:TPM domain-containing protein [Candidatus Peregrinibacteria bacterium]|nr:TPM domain-containing protein [Candidatus Peregrinibacteria bacterium]